MGNKSTLIFFILVCCPFILLAQWTQLGSDIDGESANDQSGYAVGLSADGNTIVIGARNNGDNGSASGHVRVYENIANSWQQKGNDINGMFTSDQFGFSVSISADGDIIAVGAPDNNANQFESGHVRAFQFEGSDWVQIGTDIIGEALSDHSGYSVSLSDDGNRLAVGAPDNGVIEDVGSNFGQVRVFENQNDEWVQIGGDIDGENPEDNSGYAVSLNEDGSIVAIGAPNNTNSIQGAGHVRVYAFNSTNWLQLGEDIDGEAQNDKFGGAVSLNDQGNILAVGAIDHNGIGHVKVYENLANTWTQIGSNINGEAVSDEFGYSVSLNATGTVLAVGARYNSDFTIDAGHARVYSYQSGNWQQIDEDIDGEALQDRAGNAVSLSADGSIVAVSAYLNDGDNGNNSGHVRVYYNANVLNIDTSNSKDPFVVYPNPSSNQLHINLEHIANRSKVQLYTIEGKLVYTKNYSNTGHVIIDMSSFSKGVYVLKLQQNELQNTLKVIKQ